MSDKNTPYSSGRFRSYVLRVMGPARFPCATLLQDVVVLFPFKPF